jgi:hypothetical protein
MPVPSQGHYGFHSFPVVDTKYLPELVFSYNVSQNSTTGYSPYYVLFGHNPKLPVDFLLGTNQSDDSDRFPMCTLSPTHSSGLKRL